MSRKLLDYITGWIIGASLVAVTAIGIDYYLDRDEPITYTNIISRKKEPEVITNGNHTKIVGNKQITGWGSLASHTSRPCELEYSCPTIKIDPSYIFEVEGEPERIYRWDESKRKLVPYLQCTEETP